MTVSARAIGLLLVTAVLPGAGCAALDEFRFHYFESSAAGRERVFAGSVDTVAGQFSARLRDRGFVTDLRKDPQTQAVRIICTNAATRFALVLTREVKEVGEQTRVRLEWDGPADDQLGFQVLGALDVLTR
jgi:hypothetical protein